MSDLPSYPELLGDARVAAHATSATPAWLWSTDGTCILWANAVGAAIFGFADPAAIAGHHFDARQGIAAQMARLAGTLAHGGAPRLEKLRGIGGAFSRALLCNCARLIVPRHIPAILVVALESAGLKLPVPERARRLVHAVAGQDAAVAAYAAHGELLYASQSIDEAVGTACLRRLGVEIAARGHVANTDTGQPIAVARFGQGDDVVSMATFAPPARAVLQDRATTQDPVTEHVASPAVPPLRDSSLSADDRPSLGLNAETERAAITNPAFDAAAEEIRVLDGDAAVNDNSAQPERPDVAPENPDLPDAPENAATSSTEAPQPTPPSDEMPPSERRHPLRFVWQMDREGRFTLGSEEFTDVIGPRMAVPLGRPWVEVASELALDPENQVARAVATRDTWSGITVSWPVDGSSDRLKVEMSGLPIFDRTRTYLGYRGFGVCRDVGRINVLAQMRRSTFPSHPLASASPDEVERLALEPAPAAAAAAPQAADERPTLTLVPTAKNVVPFRGGTGDVRAPALSPVEHKAFRELARQLTARLGDNGDAAGIDEEMPRVPSDEAAPPSTTNESTTTEPVPPAVGPSTPVSEFTGDIAADRPLLDRLPVGILIYRFDQLLYANRAFLAWTGHDSLDAFDEAGGLDGLLIETGGGDSENGRVVMIASPDDSRKSPGRVFTIPWHDEPALVLVIDDTAGATRREAEAREAAQRAEKESRELAFIVEAASDAVFIVNHAGLILTANRGAQSLFAREGRDLVAQPLFELFAPESQRVVRHQFDTLARPETIAPVTDAREVAARVRANGHVVLTMTIGRIGDTGDRFCVVLRDITVWKTQEHELVAAKLQAERTSRAKSDFLAKVSHEVRTPLNSIIGFSDVMIEERFGPIGNERYREYLKDIRNSGEYVVSLLNDLLDLSKIEAGKLELNFVAVNLNEMVQACVMLMQPQANREHIIIRTSLMSSVKPVLADAKSVRQIVLNLLSNSIKFTGAGGQVIVSTALGDDGSVVMRVRDTGIGMDESDLTAALEPFRQLATAARWGSSGTGLGLPLTKALIEANRANFAISSKINEGTLVEVTFLASRVIDG